MLFINRLQGITLCANESQQGNLENALEKVTVIVFTVISVYVLIAVLAQHCANYPQ